MGAVPDTSQRCPPTIGRTRTRYWMYPDVPKHLRCHRAPSIVMVTHVGHHKMFRLSERSQLNTRISILFGSAFGTRVYQRGVSTGKANISWPATCQPKNLLTQLPNGLDHLVCPVPWTMTRHRWTAFYPVNLPHLYNYLTHYNPPQLSTFFTVIRAHIARVSTVGVLR